MDINRNNYEAYLLDLIEGNLSPIDQQEVRDFLAMNPDCAHGLDDVEPWILEAGKVIFPGKEQLKKEFPDPAFKLTETNFDLFSIARMEGDLTQDQENEHELLVNANETRKEEWLYWQNTKLNAEHIPYAGKGDLKKRTNSNRRVIWISIISSAAVIALIITLLKIDPGIPVQELAEELPEMQLAPDEQQTALLNAEEDPTPGVTTKVEKRVKQPVTLSIKKHQDPPELTGIKKEKGNQVTSPDSLNQVRRQQLRPGPLRVAQLYSIPKIILKEGSYDQIIPLDIPLGNAHLTSLSISQLADLDLMQLMDDYNENRDFSLWTIASAGIKGINRITGGEMSLREARDEDGDVAGFRFNSKRFSFATPLDRSE